MTIPAARFVTVNPEVISAGGNPLILNGLYLTQNLQMPTGTVLKFPSLTAGGQFFGFGSAEYAQMEIYFAGYDNSSIKPNSVLFAAYNAAARVAFLQGGSLAGLTLTQLKAIAPGTLTIFVDGTVENSASIDLSAATSFSNAAALILAGFTSPTFTVAWNAINSCFVFTATGSAGPSSTITFATGTLAPNLNLGSTGGGFLSQGAAADTPASAMQNVISQTVNFVTFTTLVEPDESDKTNFAVWVNAQNNRYAWIGWDSDPNASVSGNETCFGYLAQQAEYNGVCLVSGDPAQATALGTTLAALALNFASAVMGYAASLNFTQTAGRATLEGRTFGSIQPTCAADATYVALIANGYSMYASVATANQGFIFATNGQMPGEFGWLDTFLDQIFLNSQFQLALMQLKTAVGIVNYNPFGYGLIRNVMAAPIAQAIAYGAIVPGVALSAAQQAELNTAAGVSNAAALVQTQGWYLQILDPGADARANRTSPIINFWFTDGSAIQQITMASIDIL